MKPNGTSQCWLARSKPWRTLAIWPTPVSRRSAALMVNATAGSAQGELPPLLEARIGKWITRSSLHRRRRRGTSIALQFSSYTDGLPASKAWIRRWLTLRLSRPRRGLLLRDNPGVTTWLRAECPGGPSRRTEEELQAGRPASPFGLQRNSQRGNRQAKRWNRPQRVPCRSESNGLSNA